MKKYILFLFCITFLQTQINAQIGISATNTPPNASAMLDVSSTTKGLLPPRMTSAQRTAIPTPANGLLVFDIDTQSYWFRQSGVWTELPKGGSTNNYWQLNGLGGNEITNTNSGGFWSKNAVGLEDNSNNSSIPLTSPVEGAGTRMMWIPSRSAFRVGTVSQYPGTTWDATNIGLFSFASGYTTKASGKSSTAMGTFSEATGDYSTALGSYNSARGVNSTAIGYGTAANGVASLAMGSNARAGANNSTAIGYNTIASGEYSTAMGYNSSTNYKIRSFVVGGSSIVLNTLASNDKDYQMKMHFDEFKFLTGSSNDVTITNGQITTSNTLSVYGVANRVTSNYGYLGNNSIAPTGFFTGSPNIPYSIYSYSRVIGEEFDAFSDARHKKLRSYSNGKTDLSLLNQLKVSNYTFIDTVGKGTKMQMGFIAQQVETVVPEAVNRVQDYIPSVYDMAKSMVYDANAHTLRITAHKPHDFQAKDEIKLITIDKEHKVKVDKIIDANTFVVSNWEKSVDKLFVFGKRVDDFRTVDYDRLFTLGISSIQELSRRVEALEKENTVLKSENKSFQQLKTDVAELRAMMIK
jgi:Head domain of trimeric autotransporter adhesin/Chaperone of endosialidase